MKKSSLVAMILGTVSGCLFALGMCMALIPEWGAFVPGIVVGCIGIALSLVTLSVWRRMEGKAPVRVSGRILAGTLIGLVGGCLFGLGMSMTMVWNLLVPGVIVGMVGILVLLMLIPFVKGVRD